MAQTVQLKGFDKWKKQLSNLSKQGAKRAQRKATRSGTTVLLKVERNEVPVDEGLLKKAQTSKISNGKRYGISGIVGADQSKLDAEAEGGQRPSNIDWLVDEGHVAPDGTVIPPAGYIERTKQMAGSAAVAAYADRLAAEIAIEAMKTA